MKFFRVVNLSQNSLLAEHALLAGSFWGRLKGLLGGPELKPGEGLILRSCSSIHTFFVPFPIDVAFINKENRIIKTYFSFKPWRISGLFFSSSLCLELPAGTLRATQTQEGDEIRLDEIRW